MNTTQEHHENELNEFEMEWHHLQLFRAMGVVLGAAGVLYYIAQAVTYLLHAR